MAASTRPGNPGNVFPCALRIGNFSLIETLRGCVRAKVSGSKEDPTGSLMGSSTRRLNSLIGTATNNPFNDTDEVFMKKHGYVLGGTLGKGSYAKVKSATKDRERKKVAVKIMDRRKAATEFREKFLPREIAIAPELKHPNVVETFAVYQNKDKIYMVMELASGGDMLRYVRARGALCEHSARKFYMQMCEALEFLHLRGICHRDLKCENLLLDADSNIKLSDFGFARSFTSEKDHSSTFCGSAAYAAPEVLQAKPYDARAYDVWSSGVILLVFIIFVCGFMPFDDTSIRELIRQQSEKLKFPRGSTISKECRSIIREILNVDPKKRLKLSQIRESDWMQRNLAVPASAEETEGIRITAEENLLEDGGDQIEEPDDVIPLETGTQDEKSTARSSHHADRTRSRSRTAGRRNGDQ
ncbi:Testis-specific serine/threonine-protein kinase 1 [Hypsibius exemplaris]|uniref:Testis-specific serine/threonine-protein kinase 1 n=1 Tax=Hypsibius exemplaris TaxID=2072580 RepID=A0A9X6NJ51_HYPEX|nr:Testis-specific serine/threonine-protein kinase 1 [Hypsibius exemplaris]